MNFEVQITQFLRIGICAGLGLGTLTWAETAEAATYRIDLEYELRSMSISGSIPGIAVGQPAINFFTTTTPGCQVDTTFGVPELWCDGSFDLLDYEARGAFDRSGYVWEDTLRASFFIDEAQMSGNLLSGDPAPTCIGNRLLCSVPRDQGHFSFDGQNFSALGGSNSADAFTQLIASSSGGSFRHSGGYINHFDGSLPQSATVAGVTILDLVTGGFDASYTMTDITITPPTVPVGPSGVLLGSGVFLAGWGLRSLRKT